MIASGEVVLEDDALAEVLLRDRPDERALSLVSSPGVAGVALLNKATSDSDVEAICAANPLLRSLRVPSGAKVGPQGLMAIAGLRDLRRLQLVGVPVGQPALLALSRRPLKSVTLERCGVDDAGLASLTECPTIETLVLDGNRDITSNGFRPLVSLPGLRHLSLAGCSVDDSLVAVLVELPEVEFLNLSSTSVTELGTSGLDGRAGLTVVLPSGAEVQPVLPTAGESPVALPASLRATVPVLALFSTPWCGPCRTLKQNLAQMPAQVRERFKLVEIDVSTDPGTGRLFGINLVPTLVLLHDGEEILRRVGGGSGHVLAAELVPALDRLRSRLAR